MVSKLRSSVQFSSATFSFVVRNNSHLPCCSLSTRDRDSHVGGGMLDHSIRAPHPFYIT
jgi:hypothetical protein